jgi:Kef-type K+ transport system membrane component KefB
VKFLGLIYILFVLGLDCNDSRLKEGVVKFFGFERFIGRGVVVMMIESKKKRHD